MEKYNYFRENYRVSTVKYSRIKNKVLELMVWAVAILIVLLVVGIIVYVIGKGIKGISWHFLTGEPSEMEAGGGIGPFLFNSFYILLLSMLFSLPVGLGAGIYLAELAPQNKLTRAISICIESLASVPSIVFGLFGYVLFVDVFNVGLTIIGAAIALSLLNLPVITRVTEQALSSVSFELREASYALGATKAETIWRVVIPAALPGILTGISLTATRAFGESAVILLVGGTSTSGMMWDYHLSSPGATLPVQLWYMQSDAVVPDAAQIAQKSAAVLMIVVLLISSSIRLPLFFLNRKGKRK